LELDRVKLKESLIAAEMDTADAVVVTGLDNLADYLREHENVFVKLSFFRADMETYHHKEWFRTETWLANLGTILGEYGKIADFLVEEPIDAEDTVEVGFDGYCIDGKIPKNSLWGYEVKDAGYIGTTVAVPRRLKKSTQAFAEILASYGYRGPFSNEVKVTPNEDYLIDATLRFPSPPSDVECLITENFSEIIWEGANGNLIEPEYAGKFAAQIILKSDWIVEHALPLEVGRKDRVMLHGHFMIGGKHYAIVPEEFAEFGGAVGIGDTLEEAIDEAKDAAESVSAYQLRFDADSFEAALEQASRGAALGLDWPGKVAKAA
jgi:hypothetical protein